MASPDAGQPAQPATHQPGENMTIPPAPASPAGLPGEPATVISAGQLAALASLLTDVDEFVRCGNGAAARLAEFYATCRNDPHPHYAAGTLIDLVSFTAASLRCQTATAPAGREGGPQ
jgi:hypothetical protein